MKHIKIKVIMNNFTTFLLFLLFASISQAQIDWGDFKEPDGTLQRLTIDPRISFNSSNSDFSGDDISTFRGQLLTRYSMDKVEELRIFSLAMNHSIVYNSDNRNSTTSSSTLNAFNINGTYTQYLTQRRGLFLRAQTRFSYTNNGASTRESQNNLSGRFVIGYGRLENVSTVYQAIRIDKNLYGNEGIDQDKLFDMAAALRSIDYNNALDTRMRTVENQATYLQTLENYGYDVSSYINIANAIDMFRFERPFTLTHGFEVSAGLRPDVSFGNPSDLLGTIEATYARAISDIWHWTITGEIATHMLLDDLRGDFANVSNTVSYIPTARTQINFNQSYVKRSNSDQLNLGINASYFVSPQLNLFANTNYNTLSNFNLNLGRFSHDMGLKYFFF